MPKRILQASSHPGDLVLDGFAGSGTTLPAAEVTGPRRSSIDKAKMGVVECWNRLRPRMCAVYTLVEEPGRPGLS